MPELTKDPRLEDAAKAFSEPWQLESDRDVNVLLERILPLYFTDPEGEGVAALREKMRTNRIALTTMQASDGSDGQFLVRDKLNTIRVPTLVLVGQHDFICSPVQAQIIHEGIRLGRAKVSTDQHVQLSVTWNQVAAFRLSRHHLSERAPTRALISVVHDMAGAQAQRLSAAQISLWSRVRDLRIAHVEQALSERSLVKASCMRRTLFLVPSEHLAIFVRGSARRAEKGIRWARAKGLPDRVVDAAIDATLRALDQPLTRPEIADRVSRALGVQMQAIHGGGWGSRTKVAVVPIGELTYPVVDLLHLVAARGVVCYGPDRDNEPTFVRADAWIPQWQDVVREQAEGTLLRKYLRAFGPATEADFALWSGMTLTDAREIWAREQANVAPVNVEGWVAAVLREDLEELAQAKFERPLVRLLPYFDSYLLGHKEREHLVSLQHRPKVYRPQGWIAPVVLVDGRASAVWAHTRQGNRLSVAVSKFESLSRRITADIREAAHDLGGFLGATNVDIQIN